VRTLRQGRFYPELTLGAGALSAGRRAELGQFLLAVVHHRGFPLHLASLWNALYFSYDLDYGGFRADHLEQKRIPIRTAAARDFALPVGGFIRVHTETVAGDLLAEVVYKQGAHPQLDSGWIPPALSGCPASVSEEIAGSPLAVLHERYVLDLAAFGPDATSLTLEQYERICGHGRWLDHHGHLLMDGMYEPAEAELEDLDYYADYLLREHRDGLLAFCFSEDLSDEELSEALLRSFEAVREIALSTHEFRSWRDKYFFGAAGYERQVASNGPLGGGDLRTIYTGLTRVPAGGRGYSAISERILELLERGGSTAEEESLVRGCAYATAVCHANLYVTETLAQEQRGGWLPRGVHLRLDDDWQAGGVWRAERVEDSERYSLADVPPTLPLGLGFAESGREAEVTETITGDERPIASTQTGFRVALTMRDRALRRLRLSSEAASALAPGAVEVVLRHGEAREQFAVERDGGAIFGVTYPWDLHPGIVLGCNVESGGGVVRIRTLPITPPVVASDGTSLGYETNLSVYERELRLKQLSPAQKRGAPSLRELVNRAFRLCGQRRDDGARSLTLSDLATVVLGPAWRPTETRTLVETIASMEIERNGAEYAWRPHVSRRTRASDRSLLAAYGETTPRGAIARSVRRHWVPMHLRHYTLRSPSDEKRATYAEARRQHGMHGVLPEELPSGCSWVEPYFRGGDDEPEPNEPELVSRPRDSVAHPYDDENLGLQSESALAAIAAPQPIPPPQDNGTAGAGRECSGGPPRRSR